ncbi:MAG: superoxide dismutase [Chloroflexi bacterium]|nr:superoxide dismutase [Chloroflexota bacterium]
MTYKTREYRLTGMDGLSDNLLKNHYTLYEGYVNNVNKLLDLLAARSRDGANPEYAELKRRFGFEFNGMRLHEYYFENLVGKGALDQNGRLAGRLNEAFGGYQKWEEDFKATGKMRGVGWAVLFQDVVGGQLLNVWVNEHHVNNLAGCQPVLVMDVWEHAFMTDYGLKRADYIEAFFRNINWTAVEGRLKA